MLTKCLKGTRYLTTCEEEDFKLDYYLVKEELSYQTYGVEIQKRACNGSKDTKIEEESVHPISESEQEVKRVIDKLICYTVTPIGLVEVIDDIISESIA